MSLWRTTETQTKDFRLTPPEYWVRDSVLQQLWLGIAPFKSTSLPPDLSYLCVLPCTYSSVCPKRPEEGAYSLGADITGICEPPDVGAGIQTVALSSLQSRPSSSYCSVFLLCLLLPCVLVGRTRSGLLSLQALGSRCWLR